MALALFFEAASFLGRFTFRHGCFGMALDILVRYPMQQCLWFIYFSSGCIFFEWYVIRGEHGSESGFFLHGIGAITWVQKQRCTTWVRT